MLNGTSPEPLVLSAASSSSNFVKPYTIVAFGALLVYDYLCTLTNEVSLVWSQSWNIGTVLFLLNRYPPFVDTFLSLHALTTAQTPEVCLRNFKTVTWLIVSGIFIAETILMMRTYALFERKRWMGIILCVLMALVILPGCVVVELELESLSYGYPEDAVYTGCYLTKRPSDIIFVDYLLILFSETIVFGLTAFKAVQHLRRSHSPLVINLYRNGLLFYVYILLISLANVIVPVVGPSYLSNWLATPQRVLHSIFCTRVLLSLLHDRKLMISSLARRRSRGMYEFTTLLPVGSSESGGTGTELLLEEIEMSDLQNGRQAPA